MRKSILIPIIFMSLICLFITNSNINLQANSGLYLNSTFNNYQFHLSPGEESVNETNISFHNESAEVFSINLEFYAAEGISLEYPHSIVLAEYRQMTVPLSLSVGNDVLEGSYTLRIEINYKIITDGTDGQLQTQNYTATLNVIEKNHNVNFVLVDYQQLPIIAPLIIYKRDETLTVVANSIDGKVSTTLNPGNYKALAYNQEKEILNYDFIVAEGQVINDNLVVKSFFIEFARQQLRVTEDNIFIQIDYQVLNLYSVNSPVHIGVEILKEGIVYDAVQSHMINPVLDELYTGQINYQWTKESSPGIYSLNIFIFLEDNQEKITLSNEYMLDFAISAEDSSLMDDIIRNESIKTGSIMIVLMVILMSMVLFFGLRKIKFNKK